jgi:DHA2 family multidrug resistance protein
MTKIIQDRRDQFHLSRIDDTLTSLNVHVHEFMEKGRAFFFQRTGDPVRSKLLSLQMLDDQRQQQAAAFAYFDVFFLCAVLSVVLVFLVPLMKRSVAEPGEHIGAE